MTALAGALRVRLVDHCEYGGAGLLFHPAGRGCYDLVMFVEPEADGG
jgi:hypothetical protein